MHKIYVYGTLMPREGQVFDIPGFICDLGWFPGCNIDDKSEITFKARVIEADDEKLKSLDAYEGYYEDMPSHSLYLRRAILDGWIYEYNKPLDPNNRISDGDWERHCIDKQIPARNEAMA